MHTTSRWACTHRCVSGQKHNTIRRKIARTSHSYCSINQFPHILYSGAVPYISRAHNYAYHITMHIIMHIPFICVFPLLHCTSSSLAPCAHRDRVPRCEIYAPLARVSVLFTEVARSGCFRPGQTSWPGSSVLRSVPKRPPK